jgi:hypothetical protein
MAVTLSNNYKNRNSSGDITVASVVVGASDTGIIVLTSVQDSNHANYPVVSITRDGQAFTKIAHYEPAGNVRVEAWYLNNPNVNTSNIVIDVTGSVGEFTAHVGVVSGNDTTTMIDAYNGGSGNGFAPSVSLTTTVDDDLLFHILCAETDVSDASAGQTTIQDYQDQSYENAISSYKAAGAAGAKTMQANMGGGQPYAQIAVAVKAATGGGGGLLLKDIIGVGVVPFAR